MKVFVSGQLQEKEYVKAVYLKLQEVGMEIAHDWTRTENLPLDAKVSNEAGERARRDIQGVIDADIYILLANNSNRGKGMYAELGAALALATVRGTPSIYVVGPINHESIFYHHPLTKHFSSIDDCVAHIKAIGT
jgi:hypothetical protein